MVNPETTHCDPADENLIIEETRIKRNVLEDMKEMGRGERPEPQEDWDLIWVLSGPPIDIAEDFKGGNTDVIFEPGDGSAKKDIARGINESRERLETGMRISKEVAARRLNKGVQYLTTEDVENFCPPVYWNATDWANNNLRERIGQGFLRKFEFPSNKVIVSSNLGIKHTGHQFEKMENGVVDGKRKVVIITDTYHLPRIKRYLNMDDCTVKKEDVILFPSEPRRVPIAKALGEIKKVPKYIKNSVLPKE